MKKVLFVAALGMTFAMVSCKKDYTCECTTSVTGVGTSSASTTINDTKKNAEAACDEGDATTSVGGVSSTVECTLK